MGTASHRIAAAVTMVLVAVVAGACGSSGDSASGGSDGAGGKTDCPLSALDDAEGKVKITFWYGDQQGKNKEIMEQIAEAYNASQDKVQVSYADQGQGYAQMLDKYTRAIGSDSIPNVMFADSTHAQFLMDSGTIIPGGVCADSGVVPLDHIFPVVKNFYTLDGDYVPGAVNLTSTMTYLNQVPFEAAGLSGDVPGTLAALRSDSEKIADAHIADMKWPVSMVPSPGIFNALVTGVGVPIVDNDNGHAGHATKAVFDTPEVVDVLETLQSMYSDGLIAKISNTPGQLDQYLNVAQGKSAMVLETSAAATTIEDFLGGGMSADDLKAQSLEGLSGDAKVVVGFGPLPGVKAPGQVPVTGGAYYVTNGGTKLQQAAAMDYIRFINATPQQVTWLVEGSYISADERVADTPEVKKFYADRISGMALEVASEQLAKVPADQSGPMIGPFDEYERIIRSMMESVMFNGSDAAKALSTAEADVTAAIENYNDQNDF